MASKNKIYTWTGTNKHGNPDKGEIGSSSASVARAMLRKKGVIPKKVSLKRESVFESFSKKPVTSTDITVFSRQLATMMKAGVPMIQSFEITSDGFEKPAMRDLITKIKDDISGGTSFSSALLEHPNQFDNLYCSLAATGETSGTLDIMLDRIAEYKEKSEALRVKIKKAMTYPIIVMVFASVVTSILLIKVVPQFAKTFSEGGKELPLPTQVVMNISDFAVANWLYIAGGLIAVFFILKHLIKSSQAARNTKDTLMLKAPVVGDILEEAIIARFCRTLSTTFSAGVPVVDALNSVSKAANNVVFSNAIDRIKEEVIGGRPLHQAIKTSNAFPARVSQMVSIGEESGSLDEMLDKVATYYENAVDNKVDNLTTLIEPMIMGFLAVVVGGLMIAMYMPMFQLGDVV